MESLGLTDDYVVLAGTIFLGMSGVAALLYKLSGTTAPPPVKGADASAAPKPKKAKKKKTKAAAPAPVLDPEPEPEPEPVPEPKPTKSKKKKSQAAAQPAVAPAPAAPAPKPEAKKAAPKVEAPPPVEAKPMTAKEKKKAEKKAAKKLEQAAAVASEAEGNTNGVAAPKVQQQDADDEWTVVEAYKPRKNAGSSTLLTAMVETQEDDGSITIDLGDALGTVIGKGGSSIKHIEAETSAKLTIEKGNTICKISGSPGSVQKATAMVQAILDRRSEELANVQVKVVPVGTKAPAVLGKGGCNVRKITEESGAKLDVSCEAGTVTISGTEEQIRTAEGLVNVAIHGEAQERIELGQRGVYVIKGAGGATIRKLQEETGARFDIDTVTHSLTISGTKAAVSKAAALARQTLVNNSYELEVTVEESDIGVLVGKGGSTIKQIQLESGASVEIQRLPGFAVIKLVGTTMQVQVAKSLVEKAVSRLPDLKPGEVMETLELGGAVGMVIGPSGATVKQLQEETGAKVDIARGCGTCRVFGPKDAVAAAKAKIEEKLAVYAEREAKAAATAAASMSSTQAAHGAWESAEAPVCAPGYIGGWEPAETPSTVPVVAAAPPVSNWGAPPAIPGAWAANAVMPEGVAEGWIGGSQSNPEPW